VPESFRLADYADCLSGFPRALDLAHPYVAGLSFGAVSALELFRRHGEVPQRLILAIAYAGWAGSFRSDIVEEHLRWSLEVSRLPAAEFVAAINNPTGPAPTGRRHKVPYRGLVLGLFASAYATAAAESRAAPRSQARCHCSSLTLGLILSRRGPVIATSKGAA
jgi:pimeloyl-ACP methyl ester carboxylesterase